MEIGGDPAHHIRRRRAAHTAGGHCLQVDTRRLVGHVDQAERRVQVASPGEYPVMLLDDVLSELDPRRQEYVLNRIRGGQVFITCCENDRLDTMLRGRVFHIRNGEVL